MLGRLNHVAIAVRDIAKASDIYRRMLGAKVQAPNRKPPTASHGLHHSAEHQDRAARAVGGNLLSPSFSIATRRAGFITSAMKL